MLGCEECIGFLNNAPNFPVLLWKYSFDVLLSISAFFFLLDQISALYG